VEAADGLSKRSKSKHTSLNPGSISDEDDRSQSPPKALVRKKIKELKVDKRTASGKEKKAGKGKAKEAKEEADNDEANSDLENAYLGVKMFAKDAKSAERSDSSDSDDSADGGKHRQLVHESLQTSKRGSHLRPKAKFVPADETPELRDSRTIFVGNLSVEVAQKRVCFRLHSPAACPSLLFHSPFSNNFSATSLPKYPLPKSNLPDSVLYRSKTPPPSFPPLTRKELEHPPNISNPRLIRQRPSRQGHTIATVPPPGGTRKQKMTTGAKVTRKRS